MACAATRFSPMVRICISRGALHRLRKYPAIKSNFAVNLNYVEHDLNYENCQSWPLYAAELSGWVKFF